MSHDPNSGCQCWECIGGDPTQPNMTTADLLAEELEQKREELRYAVEDRIHEDEIAGLRAEIKELRERYEATQRKA